MAAHVKALMAFLIVGCTLTALISFSHTQSLEVHGGQAAQSYAVAPPIDPALATKLQEFPNSMQGLERRLLDLEKSIQDLASTMPGVQLRGGPGAGGSISGGRSSAPLANGASTASAAAAAASAAAGESSVGGEASPLVPGQRFRHDQKCGKNSKMRLPDGGPVECDPGGQFPCCSGLGWCGNSPGHCTCKGCVDYRNVPRTRAAAPAPAPSSQAGGPSGTSTVIVVIPFRDREGHLVKFKQYWRWFAKEGRIPRKVARWEMYVVEQFDSETFNRGWNFNVGLAVASAQASASPDITPGMKVNFDCAVIQDVDYLPEKNVDYADCAVPTQLSAEIDRYKWKTPYLASAGGIVGMNLAHWRQINGFGNNYFGWGGEDDELHHRLRLNKLLFGDCYPFCKNNNDPNIGKKGISIKRPRKGYGRFSGKYMHSANHTKRITDSKAYARNVKMLQEIENGSDRWKTDGLSSLAFRILHKEVDSTDSADGITYHHVKVHRGNEDFDLRGILLAVPSGLCEESSSAGSGAAGAAWSVTQLGDSVPWDIAELRVRATSVVESAGGTCSSFAAKSLSFILIDRRRNLAKILTDGDPRLLIVFYRSLKAPQDDGLIVADARGKDELQAAFSRTGAYATPATEYSVCTSPLKTGGPKYSVHQGPSCSGGGWERLDHGYFRAYAKPRNGFQAVSWCDNEKYWIQRIVKGDTCEKKWAGLKWVHGGTFFAARGSGFCVGTRQSSTEELTFSRLLAKESCGGDDFRQDLNFDSVSERTAPPALTVCIGKEAGGSKVVISAGGDSCQTETVEPVVRFAARTGTAAAASDRKFCVEAGSGEGGGDLIREAGRCSGRAKFTFAVPTARPPPAAAAGGEAGAAKGHERLRICLVNGARVQAGAGCSASSGSGAQPLFEAPSAADVAASTPPALGAGPLYTLLEEEVPCFGFICPSVVQALASAPIS